jgi:hypothetical protein
MQKAAFNAAVIGVMALLLCHCSSTTEPEPAPGSDWLGWEEGLDFDNGRVFYLDPVDGSLTNPGTVEQPLGSLQEVLDHDLIQRLEAVTHPYQDGGELELVNPDAPIQPGDTLVLLSGDHGLCRLVESHHSEFISILAGQGEYPVLAGLELLGVERYRIAGITIRGLSESDGTRSLLDIESHGWRGPCRYIIVEDCLITSQDDATNWSANDWNDLASTGVSASGDFFSLRRNHLLNVNHGLMVSGNYAIIEHNIVENFCGDGMRGIGNDMVFEYNTVKNCYDVNENHDDGFQSFSVNGQPPRERIVLRGNVIIGYSDPDQPYRGTLQGIGCFDGMYIGWVVENNIVATDHWHGITFLGAQNCRIVNNTVVDLNTNDPGPPWVRVGPHKDGRLSSVCIIRNNIAASVIASDGVTADHNLETTDYEATFIDYAGLDLRLLAASPAVDSGSADLAPPTAIDGTPRPQGAGIDLGAYER